MKLEALQSLSVIVMIVGLFLSALGGFGAYFFSGGSERAGRAPTSAQVESVEPEMPEPFADPQLASITEPVAEVTAKQLSLIPESTLPTGLLPVAEELPEPKLAPIPDPAPVLAKAAPPEKKAPVAPVAEKIHAPEPAAATPEPPKPAPVIAKTAPPEKKAPATPAPEKPPAPAPVAATPEPPKPAPVIAKIAPPEKKAPATPAPEKPPTPAPVVAATEPTKPAKSEPALVVAKAATPAPKPPAAVTPRASGLGIEPWQKEKLLQRLRAFPNGTIAIQTPEGHPDAMAFATALKESFVAAGWHVTGLSAVKTDREASGLTLSSGTFPPPTEVTTVFSALISAGMKLSTDLDPSLSKKHAILFVGSRP